MPQEIMPSFDLLERVDDNTIFRNLTFTSMPLREAFQTRSLTFDNVRFVADNTVYSSNPLPAVTISGCAGLSSVVVSDPAQVSGTSENMHETTMTLVNNPDLSNVSLDGFSSLALNLKVGDNAPNLTISTDMGTGSLTLSDVAAFTADQLSALEGSDPRNMSAVQTIANNSFRTLSLPNLTWIRDPPVAIHGNPGLGLVDFPQLANIAILKIQGDDDLIVRLPEVERIVTLDISGSINSVVFPPAGNVDVESEVAIKPNDGSVCSNITDLGPKYQCGKHVSLPAPGSTAAPASSASHGSHSGLSQGAKIGIGVGVGLGGLLILLGTFFLFRRGRKGNARNPRSAGPGEYALDEPKELSSSPVQYSKVPTVSNLSDEPSEPQDRPVSAPLAEDWTPPDQEIPSTEGRAELEEQQGMRHEMDARSLPDMDDDDDEEDTRSLQDIERIHGQSGHAIDS